MLLLEWLLVRERRKDDDDEEDEGSSASTVSRGGAAMPESTPRRMRTGGKSELMVEHATCSKKRGDSE
jgi:hypothetical protein